jgi:ABC-type multidrug transport system fused ATPase/permease subunit
MDRTMMKKISRIVLNVLMYAFLAICILTLLLTLFSKRDADGAAEVFGYQMRVVVSNSMGKCDETDVSQYRIKSIPIHSLIFVKVMPDDPAEADEWYRSLKTGDVLTFRYVYTNQVTITHRITSITEKETGGFVIALEGDNKSAGTEQMYQTIDTSIPNNTNYVIGKVTGQAYLLGLLISFLSTKLGLVLAIMLPCLVIILLELRKIFRVMNADKKQQEQEEKERTENELQELRRRLAELESAKSTQQVENTQTEEDKTE